MNSKAYLCVGQKYGDLASVLPLLCEIGRETGSSPIVVVAKQFADLVEDCPLVTADVWGGDWFDLRGALKYAKRKYREVVCLSTFGDKFPIEHRFQGFQLDQWNRGGMVNRFGKLPLVLRRNPTGHDVCGCILLADASESSPFEKIDELERIIQERFPARKIVRLSSIKVSRVSELVSIYNDAAALVTIDTIHLHLSAASSVPVLALATDKPTPWHGSSFQSRFKFYCRYGEFTAERERFMAALDAALGGPTLPKVEIVPTSFKHGYNPSVTLWEGKRLHAYRYAHEAGSWMTRLAVGDRALTMPATLDGFSIEDARFFVWNGKLHLSYTISTSKSGRFYSACGYGELARDGDGWKTISDVRPKVQDIGPGGNKNFLFFEAVGKLNFIYGIAGANQVVCEIRDGSIEQHLSPAPKWEWGEIRGGAMLPYKGGFLRFFHSRVNYPDKTWRYFVGASVMESKPPFRTLSVSKRPIVQGNELFVPTAPHWFPNVCIAYGSIQEGDKFIISAGRNHAHCELVELTEKDLNF